MRMKPFFAWILLGAALLSGACSDIPPPQAPLFVLPSDSADPCDLAAQRPKLVLLLFWLSSCPYCRQEIPEIHALADVIDPQKVVIYAIHAGGGAAAAAEAEPLMAHPNVRICWDDLSVSNVYADLDGPYRLSAVPHLMWVDSGGTARRPHTGVTKASTLRKDLEALLGTDSNSK